MPTFCDNCGMDLLTRPDLCSVCGLLPEQCPCPPITTCLLCGNGVERARRRWWCLGPCAKPMEYCTCPI